MLTYSHIGPCLMRSVADNYSEGTKIESLNFSSQSRRQVFRNERKKKENETLKIVFVHCVRILHTNTYILKKCKRMNEIRIGYNSNLSQKSSDFKQQWQRK